ncbi:MAG: thioredoxin [Acidobacteria bacterium]|nr:thioredoxin [Acidobacteriota bacterium]
MIEINEANFQQQVLDSEKVVLIDFWAPWCAPCRMVTPILEALDQEYDHKLVIGKLNVDENIQIAGKYNIRGIPTLLLFKNGQVVEQIVGASPKDSIARMIDKHI